MAKKRELFKRDAQTDNVVLCQGEYGRVNIQGRFRECIYVHNWTLLHRNQPLPEEKLF